MVQVVELWHSKYEVLIQTPVLLHQPIEVCVDGFDNLLIEIDL
jgi:hypothetical protein